MAAPTPTAAALQSTPAFASPARRAALYADFSNLATLNPAGFSANVAAWSTLLRSILESGAQSSRTDTLVLHATDELLASLSQPKLGLPYGLSVTLAHQSSAASGSPPVLVSRTEFMTSPTSVYSSRWTSWVLHTLVGTPLKWGWSKLGFAGETYGEEQAELRWKSVRQSWVHLPLISEAAEQVLERYNALSHLSTADRLYSRDAFEFDIVAPLNKQRKAPLSKVDVDVLIKYLQRDRRVLVSDGTVIKFKSTHVTSEVCQITETDRGIVQVKQAVIDLEKQTTLLSQQIEKCTFQAKTYLSSHPPNKTLASNCLRLRTMLNSTLTTRTDSLFNLTKIQQSLLSASTDEVLQSTYVSATQTLKTLHTSIGGVEKVEMLRDELEQVLENGKEMNQALIGIGSDVIDEDEVEQELQELVKREEEERELKKKESGGEAEGRKVVELEERLKALQTSQTEPPATSPPAQTAMLAQ